MSQPTLAHIVRKSVGPAGETDAQLIARFVGARDEAAFRGLVQRHGPTVLAACRQVLADPADIDDAFQATFLVLFRMTRRFARSPVPLGAWLFGVAHRVAVRCRADRHRRTARETEAARRDRPATELPDLSWREAAEVLHEELNALPDKYRLPLLLCGVRGLTRDEAAEQLSTTVGAVRGHLDRGRALLEKRLTRRGIVLSVGWLALVVDGSRATDVPPARFIDLAVGAAFGQCAPTAAALAAGVLPVNRMFKPLVLAAAALLVAAGFGFALGFAPPDPQPDVSPAAGPDEKSVLKAEAPAPRAEKSEPKPAAEGEAKEQRTITGTVLDSTGKPVSAELSLVWRTGAPQPLGRANADGTFKFTVPFKRNGVGGRLVAKAPGHGMGFRPHGLDSVPESLDLTTEMTLRLPKERVVRGQILDSEGTPVVGAMVVANYFSVCDTEAAMDLCLESWAARRYHGEPPSGDRTLRFPDADWTGGSSEGRSPYTAITDKDGRFEIAGAGANQLVGLRVRGAGVADKEIVMLARIGFNPTALNQTARGNEEKGDSYAGKWVLYGPNPSIVLELEKPIRGRVTDHEGKPRAGVMVTFSRLGKSDINPDANQAVTGADGRYEIRGARKHKNYMVEVPPDADAGLLPCQGFAADTPEFEPITIDLKCPKGLVVTGTVTNKATGKPIATELDTHVLADNPFTDRYPPFQHSISRSSVSTRADGRFRLVTVAGPVLLTAGPQNGRVYEFKPVVPDPNFADWFQKSPDGLGVKVPGGYFAGVSGCWCRVLDAKPTDTERTVNVELEPAPRTLVKVVDTDGKPVTGAVAVGVAVGHWSRYPVSFPSTDTISVFNQEPGKDRLVLAGHPTRKLVGSLLLKTGSKDPVVTLGPGGQVTGRAVDEQGRPLAGLQVIATYPPQDPLDIRLALDRVSTCVIGADGRFQIDAVLPGQKFWLEFRQNGNLYRRVIPAGVSVNKPVQPTVAKHGDAVVVGDVPLKRVEHPGR